LTFVISSQAHVELLSPTGGESYNSGVSINIQWQELINHNTLNWDLYFSSNGGTSWELIKADIAYETLNYVWILPDISSSQARIKVVQDNEGADYESTSGDFTIGVTTDIGESIIKMKISVYPNPMKEYSIFEFDNKQKENYSLIFYNLQGVQVKRLDNIFSNTVTLYKDNFKGGLLLYQLIANKDIRATGKIVIE